MKTIKDISLMLGVSHTTVYNHVNKLNDELKGHKFKIKGTTFLDDEGIRQLKISMGFLQVPQVRKDISMENIINEISEQVTDQITINIKNDMEELKKQIQELKELLEQQHEDKEPLTLRQKVKGLFNKGG